MRTRRGERESQEWRERGEQGLTRREGMHMFIRLSI